MSALASVIVATPGEPTRTFADVVGYVVVTLGGHVIDASVMPADVFAGILRTAAETVETDPPEARVP